MSVLIEIAVRGRPKSGRTTLCFLIERALEKEGFKVISNGNYMFEGKMVQEFTKSSMKRIRRNLDTRVAGLHKRKFKAPEVALIAETMQRTEYPELKKRYGQRKRSD